jgi:hypothetical protein
VLAYGQEVPFSTGPSTSEPAEWHVLTELLRGGGLPAVLAMLAWWARGALGTGIPLVVSLHAEDRELLRSLRRRHEDHEPE